ncbi:MAG TPA: hypothetical protein VM451_09470 [Candidatus Limnocylindria bacterium]|nr:hypothetical protein [Candidatus Limnocylindria bacterium]
MTTETATGWFGLDVIERLPGGDPGDEPDIGKRVAAVLGQTTPGEGWQPSPFGDVLAMSLVALVCRAAPDEVGAEAYVQLEDRGGLDRLMANLERAVVRELKKAAAA